MKINASITDFPIYTSTETFFEEFKKAGADGVEIVGGYKNRWTFEKLFALSKKYNLPIVSFHQPIWSGLGAYFDETFFKNIAQKNVKYITFHPLVFRSFDDDDMRRYLEKMAKVQKNYGITMLLENMPNEFGYRKLFGNGGNKNIKHLEKIYSLGKEYGFHFTFDISHAELPNPGESKIFTQMLPLIGVVHLSSFVPGNHHLSLTEGNFQLDSFLRYLKQQKFTGNLTLEVNESMLKRVLLPYDFGSISKSIAYFRKIADKLS